MALDARTRSSIYGKLVPVLGDEDANALMSQFPAVEADELVTKQFLRAELGELRSEIRGEMHGGFADVRADLAGVRTEMADRFRQHTLWFGGAIGASTALLAGIGLFA